MSEHSGPTRASHGGNWPPFRGRDCQLSSIWYCWQGGWQIIQHPVGLPSALETGEESHRRDLSSEFITVGDADTFWHLQFFSTVTFESQRSTEDKFISLQ